MKTLDSEEVTAMFCTRRAFLICVFTIAIAILLTSANAQDVKRGGLKMDFPELEGFVCSEPKHFPNPKHGYLVSYTAQQGPWIRVNVYVYNSGLDRIPDGASSEVVKEEIYLIEVGLKELKRQGAYNSYIELEGGVVQIGDSRVAPKAQRRLFEIDRTDVGRILTDVYITGYKDHFIKIRISYPVEEQIEVEKTVAPVLKAVGEMLGS